MEKGRDDQCNDQNCNRRSQSEVFSVPCRHHDPKYSSFCGSTSTHAGPPAGTRMYEVSTFIRLLYELDRPEVTVEGILCSLFVKHFQNERHFIWMGNTPAAITGLLSHDLDCIDETKVREIRNQIKHEAADAAPWIVQYSKINSESSGRANSVAITSED